MQAVDDSKSQNPGVPNETHIGHLDSFDDFLEDEIEGAEEYKTPAV